MSQSPNSESMWQTLDPHADALLITRFAANTAHRPTHTFLPQFSQLNLDTAHAAIDEILRRYKSVAEAVICAPAAQSAVEARDRFLLPLEQAADDLHSAYSTLEHLHRVLDSETLRAVYTQARAKVSDFQTTLLQDRSLYQRYRDIRDMPDVDSLGSAYVRALDLQLREFELGGVALEGASADRFRAIAQRLSVLSSGFEEALLDAENAFELHLENVETLRGIPDAHVQRFADHAARKGRNGYLIGLDYPSYQAVMQHAEHRVLRERLYQAYVTRASDQGPHAHRFDNGPRIEEILALKQEAANLLGFEHPAAESLHSKMADSAGSVLEFLNGLRTRAHPHALHEMRRLREFALQRFPEQFPSGELHAWDISFVSERYKAEKLGFDDSTLRAYFPFAQVLRGTFELLQRLFGLRAREVAVDRYHPDVRYFELLRGEHVVASFYLDAFARRQKRSGAWMDVCRTRRSFASGTRAPVAYLNCNFTPPSTLENGAVESLLTHHDVLTWLHELGHGLHHMLGAIDVPSVGGIQGIEWDAVELPSQFMENFAWCDEGLQLLSGHIISGEKLPADMRAALLANKQFNAGLFLLRQLEFGLFDMQLHQQTQALKMPQILALLNEIRAHTSLIKPPAYNRFLQSFSHIFAGGYSAGYYAYLWAEVLSADAFAAFPEQAPINGETGVRFVDEVLSVGASRPAMVSFRAFRGRDPDSTALLRSYGI